MLNSTEFSTLTSPTRPSGDRDSVVRQAWQRGRLRWLLNKNQKQVYDQYRTWEERDPSLVPGNFPRVFVFDIGRRYGKTTLRFLIRCEDCIRTPNRIYRYSSAYQKNISEIVNDVSRFVLQTCPADLRPEYKKASQTFVFGNGSEIRLVGLDMHPDGLRGQACDGDDLSEAAFIKGLKYSIKSVLYPQYQGRPWARICLESSAPVEAESDYDDVFVEDAKQRGAYVYRTIDDNPLLSTDEREEFIRAMGGRGHVDCQREYFNLRVRDPEGSVVPEFCIARHVHLSPVPRYAHGYVGADPGTRDKFGLVFGFYDAPRCKLVVQRSWAERNAGLSDVAAVIKKAERELWGSVGHGEAGDLRTGPVVKPHETPDLSPELLQYWDGKQLRDNPYRRISDTDARTIFELKREHGYAFTAADKSNAAARNDAGSARRLPEAKLYALREWFLDDAIEIWPDSGPLAHQLNAGRWNKERTDFERSDVHGHLDCMMALVYMLGGVQRHLNPAKPAHADATRDDFVPAHLLHPQKHMTAQLNAAFGKPRITSASARRFATR